MLGDSLADEADCFSCAFLNMGGSPSTHRSRGTEEPLRFGQPATINGMDRQIYQRPLLDYNHQLT